eukprot:TRINITY_DN14118_c0_g1_i2.p1 TRINITY_DN14118_c0_g1~~TRINITY_DN14118_c0_g1_i2.p1  ORF type:complete len:183 (-),score=43.68 TRINITY_DN14118_c0_g1_i2:143-691(-)
MLQTAAGSSDKVRDAAADVGTRAHIVIDDHVIGGRAIDLSTMEPDVVPVMQGFDAWRKSCGLELLQRDTIVYSTKHGYAGAMDALGRKLITTKKDKGGLVVLDWKTSNQFSSDYAYQVAAYAHAFEEMTGEKVDEAWVVRFDKAKPKYEVRKVKSLKQSFEIFHSALKLWRATNESPWSSSS